MKMLNKILLGARWDDASQNSRFQKAASMELIDYVEVNFPIAADEDPGLIQKPIFAHTSNNPLASVRGVNLAVAEKVRKGADASNSPWIGEHLSWLGFSETGALGYVLSPIFDKKFKEVAVANTKALQDYYGRTIALELGPLYGRTGTYPSEMHFLGEVAEETDAKIILDVAHWTISNRNLKRDENFGLDAISTSRVIELHAAGMRKSNSSDYWHDAHGLPLEDQLIDKIKSLRSRFSELKAITFEHSMEGSEDDFILNLRKLKGALS